MTDATDSLAVDAKWVIDACVARGYEVGIATAGCRADFVKSYLNKRVDPDVFTLPLLASAAFQSCQPYKVTSLPAVLAHYGSPRACGILFDQGFNKRYADDSGVGFVDVDIKTGLRAKDFAAAEAEFARNCPLPGEVAMPAAAANATHQATMVGKAPPPGAKM
jgi:hypothetical protein